MEPRTKTCGPIPGALFMTHTQVFCALGAIEMLGLHLAPEWFGHVFFKKPRAYRTLYTLPPPKKKKKKQKAKIMSKEKPTTANRANHTPGQKADPGSAFFGFGSVRDVCGSKSTTT